MWDMTNKRGLLAGESEEFFLFTPHTSQAQRSKALTFCVVRSAVIRGRSFIWCSKLWSRCVSPEQSLLYPPSLLWIFRLCISEHLPPGSLSQNSFWLLIFHVAWKLGGAINNHNIIRRPVKFHHFAGKSICVLIAMAKERPAQTVAQGFSTVTSWQIPHRENFSERSQLKYACSNTHTKADLVLYTQSNPTSSSFCLLFSSFIWFSRDIPLNQVGRTTWPI